MIPLKIKSFRVKNRKYTNYVFCANNILCLQLAYGLIFIAEDKQSKRKKKDFQY